MAEPCRGDIEDYIAASPWSDWAVGVPDKPVREWGGLNWANYALALLARLSAAEQERDQEARKADFWKATATKTTVAAHAAEDRAEAAEQALENAVMYLQIERNSLNAERDHAEAALQALRVLTDPATWDRWVAGLGPKPEEIARAALAGREETGGGSEG